MRDLAVATLIKRGQSVEVSDLYFLGCNAVAGKADIDGPHSDSSRFNLAREQIAAMENGTISADIYAPDGDIPTVL